MSAKEAKLKMAKLTHLLTGKNRDADRLFHLYGSDDRDGLLATDELRDGLSTWTCLNLEPKGLDKLVDFIFLYGDKASSIAA